MTHKMAYVSTHLQVNFSDPSLKGDEYDFPFREYPVDIHLDSDHRSDEEEEEEDDDGFRGI